MNIHAKSITGSHAAVKQQHHHFLPLMQQAQALVKLVGLTEVPTTFRHYCEALPNVLPEGAEGRMVVVSLPALVQMRFAHLPTPHDQYHAALRYVYGLLREARNRCFPKKPPSIFFNQWHAPVECSAQTLKEALREQTGDLLVLPAQMGDRYRHKSVEAACNEMAEKNVGEFGLGSFEVAQYLAIHPTALVRSGAWIDCPGEVCRESADGETRVPSFGMSHDGLRLTAISMELSAPSIIATAWKEG